MDSIYIVKTGEYALVEFLDWEQIDEAVLLRQKVWENVEEKAWFAKASREDFVKAMNDGFGLICTVGGRIIACLVCILKNVEYARDCQYGESLVRVCADYSDVFVAPEYRGNGLQNLLEHKMTQICRRNGKQRILGTVAPENQYSYQNFLRCGYKEVKRIVKYGGLERILMEKTI